ncbi:hypothetical protein BGW42_002967 [Actinomortierella wolfii]|nr:hypothetical protein BGW42_002967 [Actinomortierella wolfii]KAG0228568.1 hypothetical protein BGW41_003384 [Actinomortierella wolfii]
MASITKHAAWAFTSTVRSGMPALRPACARSIHTSPLTWSNETTEGQEPAAEASSEEGATEEAPVQRKMPFRRKKFVKWAESEGKAYENPSFAGPKYISETPFPMNPLFKPTPPISNAAKDEIYKLHRSDVNKWTPRQLGTKYNISIKRVEAILRLKHLEQEMIQEGFIPQTKFTQGMEQLMGVRKERSAAFAEPLVDVLPHVGAPKFEAIEEEEEFTAADAARVLKRRPLAEIKERLLEDERRSPFKLVDSVNGVPKKEPLQTTPISQNTSESNPRFKFMFKDTSKKSPATLIREKDGTLLRVNP